MKNNTVIFQYILSGLLALFTVIFLWGYFKSGIYALGINATFFGFGFLYLYLMGIENTSQFIKKNVYWIIPLAYILVSYSFYEIPFLKRINIWLLPLLTLFFFGYSVSKKITENDWNIKMIKNIIFRKINIGKNINEIINNIDSGDDQKKILHKKIITGVLIFIGINIIIVSLLMGADNNFKKLIGEIGELINLGNIFKGFIAIWLFIIFISFTNLWKKENILESIIDKRQIDSVISGIVLGGTIFTYILFIIVQIDTIFGNQTIQTVESIANLAKTGFWQLFFISIINIIFFFVYYKKTNNLVQKLLGIFIFASVIILGSAGSKMYNYTSEYGLSYEKFFASYTIIYFGILFVLMILFIAFKKNNDILKTSSILALWMYSIIHILPMETFIFRVNTHILQQEGAKIQKYQSHMLSVDILNNVDKIKENNIYRDESWKEWTDKKIKKSLKKKWYEKNLQDFKIQK